MLEHWHRYGRDRLYPPCFFESPIGSQATWSLLMGAAIASMSMAIMSLFLVEVVLPAGYSSAPWSGKSGWAEMGLNTSCESASASLKGPASPTRAGH
jgi:hypothetical protein